MPRKEKFGSFFNHNWTLPSSPEEGGEWAPVIRVGRTVPFGYEQDPNDPDMLLPIKVELELLQKAKEHLKVYSLRKVAAWLTTASGRYISHVGLQKRVNIEKKRAAAEASYRRYARLYKEAAKKAERLHYQRIGGKGLRGEDSDDYFRESVPLFDDLGGTDSGGSTPS